MLLSKTVRWEILHSGCIIAIAALMFPGYLLGTLPLVGDHAAHFMAAWNTEQLLSAGKFFAWSDQWFAGYPMHYTYPFGADLLVVLVHKITFGALTLPAAYSITVWASYALGGLAVFVFSRPIFGSLTALLAALLMLADQGMHPGGGWSGLFRQGLWPCPLSLACGLFALHYLRKLVNVPSWRTTAMFALSASLGILFHPFALLYLAITATTLLFSYALYEPVLHWRKILPYLATALALIATIASVTLIPFLSTQAWHYATTSSWKTTTELLSDMLDGSLFPAMSALAYISGIIGVIYLLTRKNPAAFFCGIILPVLMLFALKNAGQHLATIIAPETASHIEFARLEMMMKPFWFIAAACALAGCIQSGLRGYTSLRQHERLLLLKQRIHSQVMVELAAILVSLFIVQQLDALHAAHAFGTRTQAAAKSTAAVRDAFAIWANAQPIDSAKFHRIAVDMNTGYDFTSLDLSSRISIPLLTIGWTPALQFVSMPNTNDPAVFRATNVRYLLTSRPVPTHDFHAIKTFGEFTLYAFKDWNPAHIEIASKHGAVLQSADNSVHIEAWSDNEMTFDVLHSSSGQLILHRAFFPRWQAQWDGKPMTITPYPMPGYKAISLPLLPGHYHIIFAPSNAEKLAPYIAALGLLSCLLLLFRTQDKRQNK